MDNSGSTFLARSRLSQFIPAALLILPQFAVASDVAVRSPTRYGKPVAFEVNRGQVGKSAKFVARADGYNICLTDTEAVFHLFARETRKPQVRFSEAKLNVSTIQMQFVGARSGRITAEDSQPGTSNYFVGSDSERWITDVRHYAHVRYDELYPGIALFFHGTEERIEFDWLVAANADPQRIRFRLRGISGSMIDPDGDLVVSTKTGHLRFHRPIVYQSSENGRRQISGRFVRAGMGTFAFAVGPYDTNQPLVIDPSLSYSTWFGGSNDDVANAIAVDSGGNMYVAGATRSLDFPTKNAVQAAAASAFVAKFDSRGALVYSTYLGGSANSAEAATGIAVDATGNVYVTGYTTSTAFPTTPGAWDQTCGVGPNCDTGHYDAFVTKINPAGNALVYSTFLGGSSDDRGLAIGIDGNGNAYVSGETRSDDFPTTAGALSRCCSGIPSSCSCLGFSAFVTKFNPTGNQLSYSTYLSRSSEAVLTVDSTGNTYVAGQTSNANFPVLNGAFTSCGSVDNLNCVTRHLFVTKLNGTGGVLYGSFFGGSNVDHVYAIAADGNGRVYVTGQTISPDFSTTPGAYDTTCGTDGNCNADLSGRHFDAFVSKFDPALIGTPSLVYSTFLGGGGDDTGNGIAADANGNAYVVGSTFSPDYPATNDAFQKTRSQFSADATLTQLNPQGSALIYSTFLGGSNNDAAHAVTVDSAKSIYVVGETVSADFPTKNPVQPNCNCGGNSPSAFIAKFAALTSGDANGDGQVTVADVFYLINNLFAGGPAPIGPADANGDGQVTVADVFYLINFLFAGGPAPR